MSEKVSVEFTVYDAAKFQTWLQAVTDKDDSAIIGYRADDQVQRRQALQAFVDQMELKLRKNEHKKNWREKPVEALFKLLLLEVEEFKVAHEFFTVGESKSELVDIANFAMMVYDRLSALDQERNADEQALDLRTTEAAE
jgi:hypothetical protein